MSNSNLDNDVVAISAFLGWKDMLFSVENHDYVPTIHPESQAHKRVRWELVKSGHRVWPKYNNHTPVKITGLTDTQAFWLSEYLECSKDSSGQDVREAAAEAVETRTTTTMAAFMADDAIDWLDGAEQDHLDAQEFAHDTKSQIDFARRSIKKSFASLVEKIDKALMEAA